MLSSGRCFDLSRSTARRESRLAIVGVVSRSQLELSLFSILGCRGRILASRWTYSDRSCSRVLRGSGKAVGVSSESKDCSGGSKIFRWRIYALTTRRLARAAASSLGGVNKLFGQFGKIAEKAKLRDSFFNSAHFARRFLARALRTGRSAIDRDWEHLFSNLSRFRSTGLEATRSSTDPASQLLRIDRSTERTQESIESVCVKKRQSPPTRLFAAPASTYDFELRSLYPPGLLSAVIARNRRSNYYRIAR